MNVLDDSWLAVFGGDLYPLGNCENEKEALERALEVLPRFTSIEYALLSEPFYILEPEVALKWRKTLIDPTPPIDHIVLKRDEHIRKNKNNKFLYTIDRG